MALKNVANASYTKTLQTIVGSTPTGFVVDTGVPSLKVKAEGQGVLKDGYGISVSGITDPGTGATTPDPATYTAEFSATATKVKADGTLVLRVDDETGTISATPLIPGTPPVASPVTIKYSISNAGQTKVRAE